MAVPAPNRPADRTRACATCGVPLHLWDIVLVLRSVNPWWAWNGGASSLAISHERCVSLSGLAAAYLMPDAPQTLLEALSSLDR